MSKQLFNRNDSSVIKAAMESASAVDFVSQYEETTTASAKTLLEAYHAIRGNKTQSTIRMNSGTSKNNEPIEPIVQLNLKDKMAKKTATAATTAAVETEAPKFRTETDKGEQIRVPMEQVEKMEPLEKVNAAALAKAAKKVVKEKVVKEKAPKVEKVAGAPTKQDKIVALLQDGATNKEIKLLLSEEGFKVYDSEILSAKKKVTPTTEA